MRVLNSLIVPKNVKQGPFEIFHLRSNLKDQKKTKGGPIGGFADFGDKNPTKSKKGANLRVTKNRKERTFLL